MSASDSIDDAVEGQSGDGPGSARAVAGSDPAVNGGAVDDDLRRLFWRLVVLCNVALFGLTVGPMALYFEGNSRLGVGLVVVGLVAGVSGCARYWQFRRERLTERDDPESDPTADR